MKEQLFVQVKQALIDQGAPAEEAEQMTLEVMMGTVALCVDAALRKQPADVQEQFRTLDTEAQQRLIVERHMMEGLTPDEYEQIIRDAVATYMKKLAEA